MYSTYIRQNIIDIKTNKKLSVREVARRFGISSNTVYKWGKNIKPKEQRKQRVSEIDMEKLEEDVRKQSRCLPIRESKAFRSDPNSSTFWIKKIRSNI